MPNPTVECIANFSDARRPEVIEAIMAAIRAAGATMLDRHSDLDHNRTVLTFVGPPQAVEEAAFAAIQKAAELINLDEHQGEHPRLGAADVVPFVPITGVSMQECVEMARRLGKRVGEELQIPVYLYEEAAATPERQNLENIRRGQYEALKVEMGVKPERRPDFGPEKVGPAGATVIGARHPLIAYNVYLNTSDVSVAKKIAKAIRHSGGGLRYVKGLGLLVEGQAQVSMNLTNFRGTPLPLVMETIRREAARYGAAVHHSELVGLIPQEALIDAAVWYLQLDAFEREQILEQRLASAEQAEVQAGSRAAFLEELGSESPTPGGGSAAAYSAAAGAALTAMVGRVTLGKKKYAEVQEQMRAIIAHADALRQELDQAVDRDAEAFRQVMAAFRLPKDTPEQEEQRRQAVAEATLAAAAAPLAVAEKTVEVIALALEAVRHGNVNAISDGATAAALAQAGLTGSGYNVRINLAGMEDAAAGEPLLARLVELEQRGADLQRQVRQELQSRGRFSLE
jgi:glutamate formiminotransferase / formiminotetrahydrofolate cyclodeaminase